MSLMDKLAQIANREDNVDMEKRAEAISKVASDALDAIFSYYEEDAEMSKQAEDAIEKLSEEEKGEIREMVSYGRGMARGEYLGKEAGYREGTMDMLNTTLNKVAEIYGEDVAYKIAEEIMGDAGVTAEDVQEEDEIAGLKNEIAEEAAAQLIEAAGGPDKITPEQAAELLQVAQTAGDIGLQQVMEGKQKEAPEKSKEQE